MRAKMRKRKEEMIEFMIEPESDLNPPPPPPPPPPPHLMSYLPAAGWLAHRLIPLC